MITRPKVEHIAKLARLGLTEQEIEKMESRGRNIGIVSEVGRIESEYLKEK